MFGNIINVLKIIFIFRMLYINTDYNICKLYETSTINYYNGNVSVFFSPFQFYNYNLLYFSCWFTVKSALPLLDEKVNSREQLFKQI